jgi:hypothetical protein
MERMKHLLSIAFLLSAIFPAQAQYGSIRGVVLSEEGNPVKGADVIATSTGPMADAPLGSRLRKLHLTDDTGNFVIYGLQFDEYVVTAYKEDDDYPELVGTWLLFYNKPAEPKVKLTAQNPAATAEIRLGPKAGVLVGSIIDANTRAPIHACAGFKLVSAPVFDTAYPVSSHYRLLIPSDAVLTLKVWWDGYKPWFYPGTDQYVAGTQIRLKPGEETTVNIRLQPDESVRAPACGIRLLRETAISP